MDSFHYIINDCSTLLIKLYSKATPPLPLASGQISLLLASGGINGLMGVEEIDGQMVANPSEISVLNAQERVSISEKTEETEHSVTTIRRTRREVAIKVILPTGEIKKFM